MLIVLNNKCHLSKEEFSIYEEQLATLEDNNIVLCPSIINIPQFKLKNIILGAQNVSATSSGAYTGEISAEQLASYNVKFCLVGHSERRLYQKETDEDINNKIKQLLKNNITPILCVGETKLQRDNNETNSLIKSELNNAIKGLSTQEQNKLIIAYEPIWSIGTGLTPTTSEISSTLEVIKTLLPHNTLLYGGSVSDENIETLMNCPNINGYLLGGLSLKINNLRNFLKKMTN